MKTASVVKTVIKAEDLIGTKWNGWSDMFCDRIKVEFLDKTNCIYTSRPNKYPMTYIVREGQIFISEIKKPFEIRGNMLYSGEFPVFQRAA